MPISVDRIDHLVLTVFDLERTLDFYRRVLGMQPITFAGGRRGLAFGRQKLNLHQAGREFEPKALKPTPGSIDLCFATESPVAEVIAHLASCGVAIAEGPVKKTGALGPMMSVYFRDPDGNLVEVSNYGPPGGAEAPAESAP
jgi:catechol 2,3-dioxygenase-like lactoylglutathione lyase family enzyme